MVEHHDRTLEEKLGGRKSVSTLYKKRNICGPPPKSDLLLHSCGPIRFFEDTTMRSVLANDHRSRLSASSSARFRLTIMNKKSTVVEFCSACETSSVICRPS